MAILLILLSLVVSLILSTPLLIVTKLQVRKNFLTNKSTSYCYEVNRIKNFLENIKYKLSVANSTLESQISVSLSICLFVGKQNPHSSYHHPSVAPLPPSSSPPLPPSSQPPSPPPSSPLIDDSLLKYHHRQTEEQMHV